MLRPLTLCPLSLLTLLLLMSSFPSLVRPLWDCSLSGALVPNQDSFIISNVLLQCRVVAPGLILPLLLLLLGMIALLLLPSPQASQALFIRPRS